MSNQRLLIVLVLLFFLLTSCSIQTPATCPSSTPVGLADASEIASDDSLPFQFPLEESSIDETLYFGWFGVSNECPPGKLDCYDYPELLFHAAEDYKRPAGTPVYAMADGVIHYSGRAKGYGWLILIDHPEANLYSLYGHLSPSRWRAKPGTAVARGDLIAYLGDSDENGGSKELPLDPHLHFGIRAGQIRDYPIQGPWRYHGGWIKLCPQDVGWLQPSVVITSQHIPDGGFPQPQIGFFTRWGLEIVFAGAIMAFGIVMVINLSKKASRFLVLLPGILGMAAAIGLNLTGIIRSFMMLVAWGLILAFGFFFFIRRPSPTSNS